MLGIKAAGFAKSKHLQRQSPANIPGFAKWITTEVYIEDKLAESTLEQLALSMMEKIEWINETMNDILLNDKPEPHEEELKLQEQNTDLDEDVHSNEERLNIEEDSDTSTLLIRSPRRIRERSSSPIRKIKSRELDLIRSTTSLVLNSVQAETETKNSNLIQVADTEQLEVELNEKIGRNSFFEKERSKNILEEKPKLPAIDKTAFKTLDDKEIFEDESDNNSSFEAISRNIRKSFAAKSLLKLTTTSISSEDHKIEDYTQRESPSRLEDITHVLSKPLEQKQHKSPEEEIKELSKMIEEGSDQLMLNDSDDNLSIELGKLEKIELAELNLSLKSHEQNKEVIQKSPIKFAEMPSREPLTLNSNKKKSIRKSLHKRTSKKIDLNYRSPLHHKKLSAKSSKSLAEEDVGASIFREDVSTSTASVAKDKFTLQLPSLDFYHSPTNQSSAEPTIKINRGIPKKHPSKLNVSPTLPLAAKKDLLSRLMKPTEASNKRTLENGSPIRSEDLNQKKNLLKPLKLVAESISIQSSHPSPEKSNSKLSLSKLTSANSNRLDSRQLTPSHKRKLPLTKQSLRPTTDADIFYQQNYCNTADDDKTSPSSLLLKSLEKRKKVSENMLNLKKMKTERDRKTLKAMPINHTRLNYQLSLAPSNIKTTVDLKPSVPSYKITDKAKVSKTQSIGNILPEILSDIEDEGADSKLADWGNPDYLQNQLKKQMNINPNDVFGPIDAINCSDIFNRRYSSSLNVNWQEKDRLTIYEVQEYESQMGFK